MPTDFSIPENRQAFVDAIVAKRAIEEEQRRVDNLHRRNVASKAWQARNPEKAKEYSQRWKTNNPGMAREHLRRWKANNPDRVRAIRKRYLTKKRFGITLEQRNRLFEEQDRICAICRTDTPAANTDWHTDHCHSTGEVRGILCRPCNLMLGYARDNIETLKAAIRYLEHHNGRQRREARPELTPNPVTDTEAGEGVQPPTGNDPPAQRTEQGPADAGSKEGRSARRRSHAPLG